MRTSSPATDKYMPRIADESRVFVMRFPEKAAKLPKRARKVQRRITTKLKGDMTSMPEQTSQGGGAERVTTEVPEQSQRRGKRKRPATKAGTTQVPEQLPKKAKAQPEQRVTKDRDEDEDSIPDWGDDTQDVEENLEPTNTAAGSDRGSILSWP